MQDNYSDLSKAAQRAWHKFKERSMPSLLDLGRKATGFTHIHLVEKRGDQVLVSGLEHAASDWFPQEHWLLHSLNATEKTWTIHTVKERDQGKKPVLPGAIQWLGIRTIHYPHLELYLVVPAFEKAHLSEEKLRELKMITDQIEAFLAQESRLLVDQKDDTGAIESILAAGGVGTWEWELRTGEVYINASWAQMLGYNLEELEPFTIDLWAKLIHPEEIERFWLKVDQCLDGELSHCQLERHMRSKKGEERWVMLQGQVVQWSSGQEPLKMVGTLLDITERHLSQRALRESEMEYRRLFENGPLPRYIYHLYNYSILDFNKKAVSFYGYTAEELLQMTALDLRPEEEIPRFLEAQEKVREGDGLLEFGLYIHRKKDGSQCHMHISGQRVRFHHQPCFMVIAREVTAKVFQQRLDGAERNLIEGMMKAEGRFKVLAGYVGELEAILVDPIVSINRIRKVRIENLCSPGLPPEFAQAIEELAIGPKVGSCGTAAHRGERVIVEDIQEDPLWENYRELAGQHELRACWSVPVQNSEGTVIATFALYYREVRVPSQKEIDLFNRQAKLLGLVLENQQRQNAMERAQELYTYVNKATQDAIYDYNFGEDHIAWGSGFNRLFGHAVEGVFPFQSWKELVHPEDREKMLGNLQGALEDSTQERWSTSYRLQRADGSYAFVQCRSYLIRDPKGRPLRIIGAISDITQQEEEKERMRLFQNVVVHTNDAVLITGADPIFKPGPHIVYVNQAFTQMTGYTLEELRDATPRILQGPGTDREVLRELNEKLGRLEPCEATLINYRKDGSAFWNEFKMTPIANAQGECTHFMAIERDVTKEQTEKLQKNLLNDISQIFNTNEPLPDLVRLSLAKIADYAEASLAELWLKRPEVDRLSLFSKYERDKDIAGRFYQESESVIQLEWDEGLPGEVFRTAKSALWTSLADETRFARRKAAQKAGLQTGLALPLRYREEIIGVLLIASVQPPEEMKELYPHFETMEDFLGAEIQRKRLEEELGKVFSTTPDLIMVINWEGYFIRVNQATFETLGYNPAQIHDLKLQDVFHPDDLPLMEDALSDLRAGNKLKNVQTRCLRSDGNRVWLEWSGNVSLDEKVLYLVAKDISEKRHIEELLDNATTLARIGGWESDLQRDIYSWSPMMRSIHEVPESFRPTKDKVIEFCQPAWRTLVQESVKECIKNGGTFDVEYPITTFLDNERWVRVIGKSEFLDGTCLRLYGSIQDIHERKKAELELEQSIDRFVKVAQATNDAIYDWDIQQDELFLGAGFKTLFGMDSINRAITLESWA